MAAHGDEHLANRPCVTEPAELGLGRCYGGSSYNVPSPINKSVEQAKKLARRFRRLNGRVVIRREFWKDRRRYARHAIAADRDLPPHLFGRGLETQLTKDYHRVEKGLALPVVKRPFGVDVGKRLGHYLQQAKSDEPFATYAREAHEALTRWNEGDGMPDTLTIPGDRLPANPLDPESARQFFAGRRSVRNYDASRIVPQDLLRTAVDFAINTPSVCNRQSWHIRFFEGQRAHEVLGHQNGNRGFASTVTQVAVISVDQRLFAGAGERNQPWIEGGLFAMSFVWALHALDVSTCLLNWSMGNDATAALRSACGIPNHEVVITLVAIGYPAAGFAVARSPRRSVDDVVS